LSVGKTVQLPIVGRAAADVDVGCVDGVAVALGVAVGVAVDEALAVAVGEGTVDDEDLGVGDAFGVAVDGAAAGLPPPPEQPANTTIRARAIEMRIRYVRRADSPA
jgi:hypothetical protein